MSIVMSEPAATVPAQDAAAREYADWQADPDLDPNDTPAVDAAGTYQGE